MVYLTDVVQAGRRRTRSDSFQLHHFCDVGWPACTAVDPGGMDTHSGSSLGNVDINHQWNLPTDHI